MATEIILQQTPDDAALQSSRDELATLRTRLAEREAELAQLRAQFKAFESRYFRQVGVLYAQLDDLEARIMEREADLYNSDSARERADAARQRAQQSHDAAFAEEQETPEFDPSPTLKTLFRDVARRIHPDVARDEEEASYFTLLMARANGAYRRGDVETLQRLLDDQREVHAMTADESRTAEHARVMRQIQHERRDLAVLDSERDALLASDIAHLHDDAEAAAREHRDLLTELASGLREQMVDAERRLEFTLRQVSAHGR